MPAAKKTTAKKVAVKKPASKKTTPKKATPVKKKPAAKKSKAAAKSPDKKTQDHSEATIIRVNKPTSVSAPEPRTITIGGPPKPKTFTHKISPLAEKIGGASEFEQDKATPRLKIQPVGKSAPQAVKQNQEHKLLQSHFADTEDMPVEVSANHEEQLPQVSLTDPEPVYDPFTDILTHLDEQDQAKDSQNTIRRTTVEADPVANPNSKNLVDEIESPKPFDTNHYHVPIKSRAVKSAATYALEFLVIMALITIFLALLVDAELIETSFELPFDVV